MYRILHEHHQVQERRRGHRRVHYTKPVWVARAPNQCWSWDITKLKGPVTWQYFYLYVILDLYSRYVVGWMVAERESTVLAKRLITESCAKQGIAGGQLTLHAAEQHCRPFFSWYNLEHKHAGIAMLSPHAVHYGLADDILAGRQQALNQAFADHRERFKYAAPTVTPLPTEVWINRPTQTHDALAASVNTEELERQQ